MRHDAKIFNAREKQNFKSNILQNQSCINIILSGFDISLKIYHKKSVVATWSH